VEFGDYLMNRDLTMDIHGLVNAKFHYLMILTHGFMGMHGIFYGDYMTGI